MGGRGEWTGLAAGNKEHYLRLAEFPRTGNGFYTCVVPPGHNAMAQSVIVGGSATITTAKSFLIE